MGRRGSTQICVSVCLLWLVHIRIRFARITRASEIAGVLDFRYTCDSVRTSGICPCTMRDVFTSLLWTTLQTYAPRTSAAHTPEMVCMYATSTTTPAITRLLAYPGRTSTKVKALHG